MTHLEPPNKVSVILSLEDRNFSYENACGTEPIHGSQMVVDPSGVGMRPSSN